MSAFAGCLGLLPLVALGLTILYFRTRQALFAAIAWGATVWTAALVVETNLLSAFGALSQKPVLGFWLLYVCVSAGFLLPRIRKITFRANFSLPGLFFGFILCVTLFLALAYAPSYPDSLSYHLPRIMHWLQNGSLAPYPTSIDRQIGMAPLNAWINLQSVTIGQNDWFVNLPQWLAFAGLLPGVTRLAGQLGYGRKQGLIAAFFFCTLPIAIMQSGNSESCLIVTFWLCVFVCAFFDWWRAPNWRDAILLGASLGFAILAKGVAYPVALPFIGCMAYRCVVHFRRNFLYGLLAAAIIVGLNGPHLYRNYIATDNVFASSERNIVPKPSAGLLAVNAFYHFLLQEPWLTGLQTPQQWSGLAARLGVNDHDADFFPWRGIEEARTNLVPSDNDGQSPAHALLILLVIPYLIYKRQAGIGLYLCLFCISFALFCAFMTWQPWAARLHLPWFMLAAPLTGIALMDLPSRVLRRVLLGILGATAILPLFFCLEHPLGPASWLAGYRPDIGHFLTASRDEQYFNFWRKTRASYMAAVDWLAAQKPESLGVDLADDGLEYPLWAMLRKRLAKMPNITHTAAPYPENGPQFIFRLHHSAFSKLSNPVIYEKTATGYRPVFPVPANSAERSGSSRPRTSSSVSAGRSSGAPR